MRRETVLRYAGDRSGGGEDVFGETGFDHVPAEETLEADAEGEGEEFEAVGGGEAAFVEEVGGGDDEAKNGGGLVPIVHNQLKRGGTTTHPTPRRRPAIR